MAKETYIVKGKKGEIGLLVNSRIYAVGQTFGVDEWKWGAESLEGAIKNGRCEIFKDGESDEKKSKKQLELEALTEQYSALDPASQDAERVLKKINKLEKGLE